MAAPANFANLPTEVLLLISSNLSGTGDINAICKLTRRLYYLFLPEVFDRHLAWARSTGQTKKERDCLIAIFLHAVKFNSSNLIQQLFCYRKVVDFKGWLPGTPFSHNSITYLHFAVSMDSPVVASHLMKHGSSSEFSIDSLSTTYPDLSPLYMALARPQLVSQHELNAALRIACSYALPRTAAFLLARGADARAVSNYGISVLHATLARRARWRFFDVFYAYMEPSAPPATLWEDFIWATTKTLVLYGANPRLKTDTSRMHSCDTKCWQSVNCEHSQQTPTHLAAGSGLTSVVRFLYKTVGPCVFSEKNGGGYTPLYGALVQGHDVTATYILRKQPNDPNPIVRAEDNSTALHIASRFALQQIVTYILEHGATNDINREDANGRTPLHEILTQKNMEREHQTVGTLHVLAKAGADPDHGFYAAQGSSSAGLSMGMKRIETPRQMAMKHAFPSVREMFQLEEEDIYREWCEEAKEETAKVAANTNVGWGEGWGEEESATSVPTEAPRKPKRKSKKQKERAAAKAHDQNFPALEKSDPKAIVSENLPPSLYKAPQPKTLSEWQEKQAQKENSKDMKHGSVVRCVSIDVEQHQSCNETSNKAKNKSGKSKWRKMAL